MQHEITKSHPLLDEGGKLAEAGYTKDRLMDYDRNAIKGSSLRIKEWDYYLITTEDFALALTVADNSYMGIDSISLIDFKNGWEQTTSPMTLMPMGKKNLPKSSKAGDVLSEGKKHSIAFEHYGAHRILSFKMDNFQGSKGISGEIRLENPPQESMVIATPFSEKETAFYYNQKIIAMPATGQVAFDGKVYSFKQGNSYGLLDWGRGVWPYKNMWYWSAAQGTLDGHTFGWNLGYGFGNTSAASENMLFYVGVTHKLGNVIFNIPTKNRCYTSRGGYCSTAGMKIETQDQVEDYMSPWIFTSDDGRFEMVFTPILDSASKTDLIFISSDQHQVFGHFSGKAILDDGTLLEVKNFLGFAEKIKNKW